MKRLLLALLFLLFAVPVLAADDYSSDLIDAISYGPDGWELIGTQSADSDENTYEFNYYNIPTVTWISKTNVKVWVKGVIGKPLENRKVRYEYVKDYFLYEFDCNGRTMRTLAGVFYNKGGSIESSALSTTEPGNWLHIIPKTLGGSLYQKICNK